MADEARIYVGTHDGVQVLDVRGERCELVAEAFRGEIVQALGGCRRDMGRVFAGLRHGLQRTDDAGKHWRPVLDGDFRSVTVDPTDDRVIYAGTDPVHLYRSEDGGDTWQEIESLQGLPEQTHQRLGESEPVNMATSHNPRFRHRRQDWWFPSPPHQGHILQMFIHPERPDLLLLAIEHGGVARSDDRGETWEDVSEGIDYLDMHFVTTLPGRFDRYFASSARGFYATDDPAKGWVRAEAGCDRNYFHDIAFLPSADGGDPAMVIATADGSPGFWPATKGRGPWNYDVVGSRAALFRSDDLGQTWRRIGAGSGLGDEMDPMIWALCADPRRGQALLAGVGESSSVPAPTRTGGKGWLLASGDGGETWQTLREGMAAVEHIWATAA